MRNSNQFFNTITELDPILESTSVAIRESDLKLFLRTPGVTLYFWKKVKSIIFVDFLGKEYFIQLLSKDEDSESLLARRHLSQYLITNQNINPAKILEIYRQCSSNDTYIAYDLLQLGNKLDGQWQVQLVERAKDIILKNKDNIILFGPEIIEWVPKLSAQGFIKEAFDIFNFLITPRNVIRPSSAETANFQSLFSSNEILLTSDDLTDLLDNKIKYLKDKYVNEVHRILEQNLLEFLRLEYDGFDINVLIPYDPFNRESSGLHHETGKIFFNKLCELTTLGVKGKDKIISSKALEYFESDIILFNRLALWVANNNFDMLKHRFKACFIESRYLQNYILTEDMNEVIVNNRSHLTEEEFDWIISQYLSISIANYPWNAPELTETKKEALLFHRLLNPLKDFLHGDALAKFVAYEKQVLEHEQQIEKKTLKLDCKTLPEFKEKIVDSSDTDFWKVLFDLAKSSIDATEQFTEELLQRLFKKPSLILDKEFLSLPDYSYYITYQILSRTAQDADRKFFQEDFFMQFLKLAEVISKIDDDSEINTIDINIGNVRRASISLLALIIKKAEIDLSITHRLLMSEICNTYIEKAYSESDYFDKSGDPLSLVTSITNYTPAKALLLLIEIALYESRINFRKEKYSFRRCGDQIFEIIGTILSKRGTDGLLHACLGLVLPVLYYLDSRYLRQNLKSIFPKENLKLWRLTFSAFLYNSPVSTKVYKLMRPYYLVAIRNNIALPEEIDTTPYFVNVSKPLTIHLLNATLEGTESIRNKNNLLLKSLENANSAMYAWVSHGIYRYVKGPNVDFIYAISVLYRVWSVISKNEDSIDTTSHLETNRAWKVHLMQSLFELKDHASLKKFYRLLKADISHLTRPFPSRLFFDFLIAKIDEDLRKTVTLLKIFSAELKYGYYFGEDFESGLKDYLGKAIISEDKKLRTAIELIVDRFGSLGVYELRPFWEKHFRNQL